MISTDWSCFVTNFRHFFFHKIQHESTKSEWSKRRAQPAFKCNNRLTQCSDDFSQMYYLSAIYTQSIRCLRCQPTKLRKQYFMSRSSPHLYLIFMPSPPRIILATVEMPRGRKDHRDQLFGRQSSSSLQQMVQHGHLTWGGVSGNEVPRQSA